MAPKSQSAVQPIRRNFSVPLWVWSLALLAMAFFALAVVRRAQGAPAPSVNTSPSAWMVQAQPSDLNAPPSAESANRAEWMLQAQESIAHYDLPVGAAPAVDPAMQSVLSFVTQHGLQYASEAPEVVMDADALSYTDYLRRHGFLPTVPTWETPTDPQVQALINGWSLTPVDLTPDQNQ